MITPTASFKDNLKLLPSIEMLARIELADVEGNAVASIENLPGKQGSLIVYKYLHQEFGAITVEAAKHGLEMFGEHTADATARPGAHPNIDLLFDIIAGSSALQVRLIAT